MAASAMECRLAAEGEPPPVPGADGPTPDSSNDVGGFVESCSLKDLLDLVEKKHCTEVDLLNQEIARLKQLLIQAQQAKQIVLEGKAHLPSSVPEPLSDEEDSQFKECDAALVGASSPPLPKSQADGESPSKTPSGKAAAWGEFWPPVSKAPSSRGLISQRSQRGRTPSSWSHKQFPPMDVWLRVGEVERAVETARASGVVEMSHGASRQWSSEITEADKMRTSKSRSKNFDEKGPWYIASPTNPSRLAWDLLGAILIFYDLFKLPMEAFEPPESDLSRGMDWFILIFWTMNIAASVTVGFNENGLLVMQPRRILRKYFKTWFVVDLIVVVPDWIFTIAELASDDEGGGSEDSVRLLRVLRLVRMVRLLRLLKLRKIMATFSDMINSEYVSVFVNIGKMILMLLAINHLICCLWYSIAAVQKGSQPTWVSVHKFDEVGWFYRYLTAFHWSITQFTPASMHVQPQNPVERSFTIILVVLGLVGFSYIVGSITGSLTQLRNMQAEESKLFWELRRYLKKNKVNRKLSLRITKYLEHAWQSAQESKPVKDVKLMQFLSDQLHAELKFELAVAQLKIHPFLFSLCEHSSVTVYRLSNSTIAHKLLAEGDSLFHPGESATHMYIVVEGRYKYSRVDSLNKVVIEYVDKGEDWIAEPVLWTNSWIHRGQLSAIEEGDNMTLDTKSFTDNVKLNPQAHLFASLYAQNFLEWLNSQDDTDLSDISQGEEMFDRCREFIPLEVYDDFTLPVGPEADANAAAKTLENLAGFYASSKESISRARSTVM